jgi:endo-1,4-beta-xylanase
MVTDQNQMNQLDSNIRKHRTTQTTLTLTHNGTPLAHQDAVLAQKSHKFLFGSNWGESSVAYANGKLSGRDKALAEQRNEYFLQLFNQVTLPFYWARFEPQRGQPQTQQILNTAHWYREHNCIVKGHPLCWHTLTADWLLEMGPHEILQAQLARIRRDVSDFRGVIDTWDVVNEAVIMPIFDRYDNGITRLCMEMGRIELIKAMFEETRACNPQAVLLLNDFDVSPAYDILVEGCLAAGIKIDVIGIQTHMHQGYWGVERTRSVLERFERFNLPIHFTENTIVSGQLMPPEIVDLNDYQVDEWPSTPEGEARQAEEVVLHYKSLMANPAVEAITWWDITDGGWLKAPAGLLRQDQTPKPAFKALEKLIKGEWWLSPVKMATDAAGQLSFTGFLGEYELELEGKKIPFHVKEKGQDALTLEV